MPLPMQPVRDVPSHYCTADDDHPEISTVRDEDWQAIVAAGNAYAARRPEAVPTRSTQAILSISQLLELGYIMRMDREGRMLSFTDSNGHQADFNTVADRTLERISRVTSSKEDSSAADPSLSAPSSSAAAVPGTKVCAGCGERKSKGTEFSASQLKKQAQARCKACVLDPKQVDAQGVATGTAVSSSGSSSPGQRPEPVNVLSDMVPSSSASSSSSVGASVAHSASNPSSSTSTPPGGPPLLVDGGAETEEECSICLSALWADPLRDPIAITACQHLFHHRCLDAHVEREIAEIVAGVAEAINGYGSTGPRGSCPLCRHEVSRLLWRKFSLPYWYMPLNWIPRVSAAIASLHRHNRNGATFDHVTERVIEKAKRDGIRGLEDAELHSAAIRQVIRTAIRKGSSRYMKKQLLDGTSIYYRAPTEYTVLPPDHVWMYRWGAPPTSRCALCRSQDHLTPCDKCSRYQMVFYCSDECREWDQGNHMCTKRFEI